MPRIHVCPLAHIERTVAATGARSLVTLIDREHAVERPLPIEEARHLRLSVADIDMALEGFVAPEESHIHTLLAFVRAWDRREPLLIHCYAGVSRSTAAALIAACALGPHRDERAVAQALRAASPTATPNRLLIRHADAILARGGRLSAAVESIGRGEDCFEGAPFALELD